MASRTCDGSNDPDVHADPLDPQIPFMSSLIRSDSPSTMNWKLKFALFGRRSVLCPFRRQYGISFSTLDQIVSDFSFFCCSFFHAAAIARFAAVPIPTIPGTFSVPARRFLSCAPPWINGTDLYARTDVHDSDSLWSVELVSAGA